MIGTLVRLNIRALFSRMFFKNRNQKKRNPIINVLIGLLALYVIGSLMGLFGVMFYGVNKPLFSMGLGWLYFSIMGLAVFVFCFVGSVFAAQAQLFNAKDNELLLSLPVKPSAILAGRLASLLLLEYLFEAFIAVPAFIIWAVFQPLTVVGVIFYVLAVLIIPLASLAVASLFAWLIAMLTSRLRNKNVITMVLSFAFMYLYFRFFSTISGNFNKILEKAGQLADAMRGALFPAYHLGLAVAQDNFVSFLIFLICMVAPFVLMVVIMSANFVKLATTNRGAAKIKYKERALKVSGVRAAFVKKELRHFWSNPMYIMNSGLGGVFMVVGAVILVVNRSAVLGYLEHFNKAGLTLSPAVLVCTALAVISALNFVSAPSVSLEGKNLWIAKSLPVQAVDVLMAKVQMHMLVCGLPALAACLISAVAMQVNALEFFLILAVPLLLTLMTALFGVVTNLQFPKFDWINELQPIKQSVSVLLSMFGTIALIAALVVLYVFVLSGFMNVELFLTLCAALFAVLSGIMYGYLRNGGSRRFEALNN